MHSKVTFDSSLFSPYLPDDAQANPNCYGAELAFWLSKKLAERGVFTSYPIAEDWGWFIEYITESEDEFWLRCTNRDGSADQWQCILEAKPKSWFGRNKPSLERAETLLMALRAVLEGQPEIGNIRWGDAP
ncbi:hypothetical protein JCM14076_26020 [Methylosoma difficile]